MRKRISYRDAAHGRLPEGSPGEERGESAAVEAAEIRSGVDGPIGPRAVGPADEAIPHAGSPTAKPGAKGGADHGHPLNKLHGDGAGTGTDGSSSGAQGGESPATLPGNKAGQAGKQPLPAAPDHRRHVAPPRGAAGSRKFTGGRREVGTYLASLARKGAR